MPNKNLPESVNHLILLAELGKASSEFIAAEIAEKNAKMDYQCVRNDYLYSIDPDRELKFSEVVDTDEFQIATGDHYQAYKKAKQNTRNAKARMLTKWRSLL